MSENKIDDVEVLSGWFPVAKNDMNDFESANCKAEDFNKAVNDGDKNEINNSFAEVTELVASIGDDTRNSVGHFIYREMLEFLIADIKKRG